MNYEMLVGLRLNINRIRWQRAHEVSQGIKIALSKDPLPKPYFEAISLKPGDADRLEHEENSRRAIAKARHDAASGNW